MRVAVLPTGRTEWRGLCGALQRRFPDHEFYRVPSAVEDVYDGFTSVELKDHHEVAPPESASLLIGRAAQEALGDRAVKRADAVVVVDDLELANAHQPDRAVSVMRAAARDHLDKMDARYRPATEAALRHRVSFHLVVPMIEAWLFVDAATLVSAGMPPGASPVFPAVDLEAFLVNDPAYMSATESFCPCWSATKSKKNRPKWLGSSRDRHPKGYLQWLCLDGLTKNCTTYHETDGGGGALERLDLRALVARPVTELRYARALVADLAFLFGEDAIDEGPSPVATSLCACPRNAVLRNA